MRLFDSTIWGAPHPELPDLPVYSAVRYAAAGASGHPAQIRQLATPRSFAAHVDRLAEVIEEFRPDIVHSHEIQHAGALVHGASERSPALRN